MPFRLFTPSKVSGYAACAAEIIGQERELGVRFASLVVPNGSSGTHAGLAAGMAVLAADPGRLLSFTVLAPLEPAIEVTRAMAIETLAPLDRDVRRYATRPPPAATIPVLARSKVLQDVPLYVA